MAIRIWEYGSSPEAVNQSTTNVQIVVGNPISCSEQFLSTETGVPLEPLSGYPIVQVLEGVDLITSTIGYRNNNALPGEWTADLTIPPTIEFNSGKEKILTLSWIFKSLEGTEKSNQYITVVPKDDVYSEDYKEIVLLGPVQDLKVTVPYIINVLAGDIAEYTLYDENSPISSGKAADSAINGPHSVLSFTVISPLFVPRLRPYNLVITLRFNTAVRQLFSNVYQINPTILSAMQALELSINKANQIETIRGLQFREVDLLQGLTRGLDYFNNVPPTLTSFTGVCMTGGIREGWLVCASIRSLRAQLQSEGMFQFDFSGQNISLNVDRQQAIESACGHYESLVDTMVRPLKIILGKKGVVNGDGSLGDKLALMSSMGLTRLSNNAITRSKLGNPLYPRTW
jgi:hypothetical protein